MKIATPTVSSAAMITPGVTTSGRLRRVLIGRGGAGTLGFSVMGCALEST